MVVEYNVTFRIPYTFDEITRLNKVLEKDKYLALICIK